MNEQIKLLKEISESLTEALAENDIKRAAKLYEELQEEWELLEE